MIYQMEEQLRQDLSTIYTSTVGTLLGVALISSLPIPASVCDVLVDAAKAYLVVAQYPAWHRIVPAVAQYSFQKLWGYVRKITEETTD